MKNPTRTSWTIAAVLVTALLPRLGWAGGLSCSIGEVVLDHLQPGHDYSLIQLAHLPLTVTNTSDRPLRIHIEPLVPGPSELRHEAEPIPNTGWASAVPETLVLAPGRSGQAELNLHLPNYDELLGRRFEVLFWSHSLPEPGEMLAYGLKSRVIFGVDSVRADSGDAAPSGDLSVALQPAEVHLGHAGGRDAAELTGAGGVPLTVRNTSDHPIHVALEALSPADAETSLDAGYGDLTAVAQVSFAEPVMTLAAGEVREVRAHVTFPHHLPRGHKLMCLVSATVQDLPVRTRILSRVYADLP